MNRVKSVWAVCLLVLAIAVVFGCSDSGGGGGKTPAQEKAENSSGFTNDGHDVLVFHKGDLEEVLFMIDTVYITDSSFLGRLFFRNLPAGKTPEPGDIINSTKTKNAPYGFLYRVVEVSKQDNDVTIVSVNYASIAEAVEDAEVEFTVPLAYDEEDGQAMQVLARDCGFLHPFNCVINFVEDQIVDRFVDGVKIVGNTVAGNWNIGGTKSKTLDVDENRNFPGGGGNVKIQGNYTLALTAKIVLKHYSLQTAKISIMQIKWLDLEGNINGKIKIEENILLKEFELPEIDFTLGPLYVTLKNDATIKAKVEVDAQTDMRAWFTSYDFSEYGFGYSDGSFSMINEHGKDVNYGFRHSTYGKVRLGVLIGVKSMVYGAIGFGISAGPVLELESPEKPLSANSKTTFKTDLDIDISADLDFFGYKDSWSNNVASFELSKLGSYKTMPSFKFEITDYDLREIAKGKLSFPYSVNSAQNGLGFSVEESGFCIEAIEDECINGSGKLGTGKNNNVFEGLTDGAYNIVPYFKSLDGQTYYITENALNFVVGVYCGRNDPPVHPSIEFDPKIKFCFSNNLYDLCGGKIYNPNTEFCSSEKVYGKCYMGQEYDPETEFCLDDYIYKLCGGNRYDPVTQSCCGVKIYNKSTEFCTSNEVYKFCGVDIIYNPATHSCCGVETYDKSTYFCSDNARYRLCGGKSYNPSTQYCLDNTIREITSSSSSLTKSSSSSLTTQSSSSSACTRNDNTDTHYCSNGTIKEYGYMFKGGQGYKTVEIGNQVWMARDLEHAISPGSACYGDKAECGVYGRLYNWSTAKTVCPAGWHLPSNADWDKLFRYVDGTSGTQSPYDSPTAGEYLKSTGGLWANRGDGRDTYGFFAMPGGRGSPDLLSFSGQTMDGYWWSANEYNSDDAYARAMNNFDGSTSSYNYSKGRYLSVRCVKD